MNFIESAARSPIEVKRNSRGELSAETSVALNDNRRVLHISTWKGNRGIVTTATVHQKSVDGLSRTHAIGFGVCGDFSKRIGFVTARATEKAIREAHIAALLANLEIESEARNWYAAFLNVHPADRAAAIAKSIAA